MSVSTTNALVTTDWLAERLAEPGLVVAEVDENPDLYEEGHIPGAVKLHWKEDLQDPLVRDVLSKNVSCSGGRSSLVPWARVSQRFSYREHTGAGGSSTARCCARGKRRFATCTVRSYTHQAVSVRNSHRKHSWPHYSALNVPAGRAAAWASGRCPGAAGRCAALNAGCCVCKECC